MKKILLVGFISLLLTSCITIERPITYSEPSTTSNESLTTSSTTVSDDSSLTVKIIENEALLEAYTYLSGIGWTDQNPLNFKYEFDYSEEISRLFVYEKIGSKNIQYVFYLDLDTKEEKDWYYYFSSLVNDLNTDDDSITYGISDETYMEFEIVLKESGKYVYMHVVYPNSEKFKHINLAKKMYFYSE